MKSLSWIASALAGALALATATGCTTNAFCFSQCDDGTGLNDGGTPEGGGGTDGPMFVDSGDACTSLFGCNTPDATDTDGCVPSGPEQCDFTDNDCDGFIDNVQNSTELDACGNCATNCITQLGNVSDPVCTPPAVANGSEPGTCSFSTCATDFYDVDGDPSNGCEYFCQHNPDGTNTTDPGGADGCGKDDDCDGEIDEDVNTCDDVSNCGRCGKRCVILNGTGTCSTTADVAGGEACTEMNTSCQVDQCDPGFADVDGSADNGCEYACPVFPTTAEICDGQDNDCNGRIDNQDPNLEADDPDVGNTCFGGTQGECIDPSHEGVNKCVGASIRCCDKDSGDTGADLRNGVCDGTVPPFVLRPGDVPEVCNGLDDDCDGLPDDNPTDAGGTCGTSVGNCDVGTLQCNMAGMLTCQGQTGPLPELCNGQDNDCDGVIDGEIPTGGPPTSCTTSSNCNAGEVCLPRTGPTDLVCVIPPMDAMGPCDVPPAPPPGATSPCQAGTFACTGGVQSCVGSITAMATIDTCGEDSNCDGSLDNQPDLQTDIRNCGTCGNDCNAINPGGRVIWACVSGTCQQQSCQGGFIDCDSGGGNPTIPGDNDCEVACTPTGGELCNGVDDDCNCAADDNVGAPPSPVQVCGVSPAATEAGCTSAVGVACTSGSWVCTFPANYCSGAAPDYCTTEPDVCDMRDNNCNGIQDDNFRPPVLTVGSLDSPCASDDGLPPPGHGQCRTTGTFQCNGTMATQCTAMINPGAATAEVCDDVDNDCDSLVDETKFTNVTGTFVQPEVVRVAPSLWMYAYEASRPDANTTQPGSGNGYQSSAPAGFTLDSTQSCSVPNKVPWFNVAGPEAAQVCQARGGRLCLNTEFENTCEIGSPTTCTRGYNPRNAGVCTTNATGSKFCNVSSFDFIPDSPCCLPANCAPGSTEEASCGINDGLLPTASAQLQNCWADWSGLQGNPSTDDEVRDLLGNLKELTFNDAASPGACDPLDGADQSGGGDDCIYAVMGGGFTSDSEEAGACDNDFQSVDARFRFFNVGFRCCFDTDPR